MFYHPCCNGEEQECDHIKRKREKSNKPLKWERKRPRFSIRTTTLLESDNCNIKCQHVDCKRSFSTKHDVLTELGEEQLKIKNIMQKLLHLQKEIPNITEVIQVIIEEPKLLNLFVLEEDPSKLITEMRNHERIINLLNSHSLNAAADNFSIPSIALSSNPPRSKKFAP